MAYLRLVNSALRPGAVAHLRSASAVRQIPAAGLGLHRQLSDAVRQRIDGLVKETPLVLFMKGTPDFPQCGFSRGVVQVLAAEGVQPTSYSAHNVLEDQELRDGIKEYSDWPTIPQVYVDGEFLGGCDIVLDMFKSGELTKVLESKQIVEPGTRAQVSDRLNS